jgi:hypothetical protein
MRRCNGRGAAEAVKGRDRQNVRPILTMCLSGNEVYDRQRGSENGAED